MGWQDLAEYLGKRSDEICGDCGCTEDEHFCESNAYITEDGDLIDICAPGFFQGWGSEDVQAHGEYAVISLPWHGTGEELKAEVETNLPPPSEPEE